MSVGLLGAIKQATPPVDLDTLIDFRGVFRFYDDPSAREREAAVGLRQGHRKMPATAKALFPGLAQLYQRHVHHFNE